MSTRMELARLILEMSYGELRSVAASLSSMKDAEVRPKIETTEEYVNLLWDWAAAEEDNDDE